MKSFDIEKIAELAMLKLPEEEKNQLLSDMEEIVSFAERIKEAAAEDMVISPEESALREDFVGTHLSRDEALAAAPEKQGEYFFVPQVVE